MSGADGEKIVNAISTDISATVNETNREMLVATYQKIENSFIQDDVRVGHFGGLKGRNDFRDLTEIAHVGFNRLPELSYLVLYLSQHPDEYMKLQQMDEDSSRGYIKSLLKTDKRGFINYDINQIMLRQLLTDFEQNIFRTAIRNYDNAKPVSVYAYWSNAYKGLSELFQNRYEPLGATIVETGVPDAIEKLKTMSIKPRSGDKTIPQAFLNWIDTKSKGDVFTISEARTELGLTTEDIKNAKKNKTVKSILDKYRTGALGTYKIL